MYIDSYILENASVHFEQNPQGRSSQSKSQSHSGKVGRLTRFNCFEPIVLELLVENDMFVYSKLLCKYMVITKHTLPIGKKKGKLLAKLASSSAGTSHLQRVPQRAAPGRLLLRAFVQPL